MIAIVLSFIFGFLAAAAIGAIGVKHLTKNGEYASAMYDTKKGKWIVRGRYLCIAGKIGNDLKHNDGANVKYL
jgi:hypothetical protein|nr:MAG TPA: hypothetical protein [Caudoviricetes sp.]